MGSLHVVAVGDIITEADLLVVVDALDVEELDRLGFRMDAALDFVRSLCRMARATPSVLLHGDTEAVRKAGALLYQDVQLTEVRDG